MKIGNKKIHFKEIQEMITTFAIAFIIALFVRSEAFALTEVRQHSMENTLYEGQKLVMEKLSYKLGAPKRGDIIIFIKEDLPDGFWGSKVGLVVKDYLDKIHHNESQKRLVKRVIGMPNDVIDIKDGKVYINGEILEESYVKGDTFKGEIEFPIKVPKENLFVMGDNRENSLDSRDLGCISYKQIEGKVVCRVWPISQFGEVDE